MIDGLLSPQQVQPETSVNWRQFFRGALARLMTFMLIMVALFIVAVVVIVALASVD